MYACVSGYVRVRMHEMSFCRRKRTYKTYSFYSITQPRTSLQSGFTTAATAHVPPVLRMSE